MATTTPNFGWPVPTSTDLVKDGATAIEALGDGIDTSMVDLKGGTTGQVLAKATNADMDFSWVTSDDANAIQNAIVDAKGDLIAASANDTPARLPVGANDLLVTAASGETTGLKYTGAWTTFTPTFTNITIGNGTLVGAYCQVGKLVTVAISLTFGSTTAITGGFILGAHPITAVLTGSKIPLGILNCFDAGVNQYFGIVTENGTANYGALIQNTSGTYSTANDISSTVPFTWGTNDQLQIQYTYRVG
jgi:hypothetical protein